MKYLLSNAQNCYFFFYNYNTYVQRYKIETNYYLNAMRGIPKCSDLTSQTFL